MTFPRLLLIFRPSAAATNPCAKMVFGSASPALLRMHGQITQWNQVMSFPMTCTDAGQKAARGLSASWSLGPGRGFWRRARRVQHGDG